MSRPRRARSAFDMRPAEPVAKMLDAMGDRVTSVVPAGYESYLRVPNPIELRDGSMALWTEVPKRNGVEPSAWMQWPELEAIEGFAFREGYCRQPDMGNPPVSLAMRLIENQFSRIKAPTVSLPGPGTPGSYANRLCCSPRTSVRWCSTPALSSMSRDPAPAGDADGTSAHVLAAVRPLFFRRAGHLRQKRLRWVPPQHGASDPRRSRPGCVPDQPVGHRPERRLLTAA